MHDQQSNSRFRVFDHRLILSDDVTLPSGASRSQQHSILLHNQLPVPVSRKFRYCLECQPSPGGLERPNNLAINNTWSRRRKPFNRSHHLLCPSNALTNLLRDLPVNSGDSSTDLWADTQHDRRHSRLLGRASILARARPCSLRPHLIQVLDSEQK